MLSGSSDFVGNKHLNFYQALNRSVTGRSRILRLYGANGTRRSYRHTLTRTKTITLTVTHTITITNSFMLTLFGTSIGVWLFVRFFINNRLLGLFFRLFFAFDDLPSRTCASTSADTGKRHSLLPKCHPREGGDLAYSSIPVSRSMTVSQAALNVSGVAMMVTDCFARVMPV